MRWRNVAAEGQPKVVPGNPYPNHYVRLTLVSGDKNWERIERGELRLLGGDASRPIWVEAGKPAVPLENDAWVVTHWLDGQLTELYGWSK